MYDDEHMDVIVPYGEGAEIIADLGSQRAERDLEFRKTCLERAKPYTVSLYGYQRRQLEQAHGIWPVRDDDSSVWALSEDFYHQELGFSIEGTALPFQEV